MQQLMRLLLLSNRNRKTPHQREQESYFAVFADRGLELLSPHRSGKSVFNVLH